ncbi:transposase [Natronolimnohabitans sp. A-GB9]|uniref:RNA-guided endonuclease InsQ/TnpB family protein n=1 Tax=Natronolimnohabitans sp. A-GB9 TaxID=3069757 RepID=UPI0027B80F35|nr:transposase [Natronolimnohabitans sp. A-GB9]MDQ2052973.1 transposase [Natronolimnohabitans sp. A-GB9]
MADLVTTRTITATLDNDREGVVRDLDSLADSASKLWNIARWTIDRIWNATGEIPDETTLKAYLKTKPVWKDLNAQSSQAIVEELSGAFQSWYKQDDPDANPPGYRKRGDHRPRSTVTFKEDGFKVDTTHQQVRLSKGENLKDGWADFILCEYDTGPDTDLSDAERVQQVRAVWNDDHWELHFVCKVEIDATDTTGEKMAGIDLGISNTAAVSFGDETLLYPGNALQEDAHYFRHIEYDTEGENGPSNRAEWARRKKSRRQEHFLHALSKDIVEQCARRDVETIAVGHPKHIRDDQDWGRHGNKRLHDWAFETLIQHIEYKAEERGIDVERVDEAGLKTSKTCCQCGVEADSNRVERGLYVCDECGLVANSDLNAAENMRTAVTPSPSVDRSNGCLAQPSVRLFDKSTGRVARRERVVS